MVDRLNDPNGNRRQKRTWLAVVVIAAFPAALTFSELSSWAQPANDGHSSSTFNPELGGYGGGDVLWNPGSPLPHPPSTYVADPAVMAQREAWKTVARAMIEFRSAEGDAKTVAQKKVVTAFTQYFDADMKLREAGLQKVESQVQKLRSQFDKRVSKKQEIIELQVKLLENEADGLGVFGLPRIEAPTEASLIPPGWSERSQHGPGTPQVPNGAYFERAVPVPAMPLPPGTKVPTTPLKEGGYVQPIPGAAKPTPATPTPRPIEEGGNQKLLPGVGTAPGPVNETHPNESGEVFFRVL